MISFVSHNCSLSIGCCARGVVVLWYNSVRRVFYAIGVCSNFGEEYTLVSPGRSPRVLEDPDILPVLNAIAYHGDRVVCCGLSRYINARIAKNLTSSGVVHESWSVIRKETYRDSHSSAQIGFNGCDSCRWE